MCFSTSKWKKKILIRNEKRLEWMPQWNFNCLPIKFMGQSSEEIIQLSLTEWNLIIYVIEFVVCKKSNELLY